MPTDLSPFALLIEEANLDPYSKRQLNADVFCECCGRGLPNRDTAYVVITDGKNRYGQTIFLPIPWNEVKGRDSVEWGSFIGSHCAKKLPKTHRVTQRRVKNAWIKNGCP